MLRMLKHLPRDVIRIIRMLPAQIRLVIRHLPISQSPLIVLLVKLHVLPRPRISNRPAPNLLAHPWMPRICKNPRRLRPRNHPRPLQRMPPPALGIPVQLRMIHRPKIPMLHNPHRLALGDQVRIDKKMRHAAICDKQLNPRPIPRIVIQHAGHPVIPLRPIRTLRQPHPPWLKSQSFFGCVNPRRHLC